MSVDFNVCKVKKGKSIDEARWEGNQKDFDEILIISHGSDFKYFVESLFGGNDSDLRETDGTNFIQCFSHDFEAKDIQELLAEQVNKYHIISQEELNNFLEETKELDSEESDYYLVCELV